MGRGKREFPRRLGQKLKQIRLQLGIETYDEMINRLDCSEIKLHPSSIYLFEQGEREPSLVVLLRYARLVQIPVELLIDDDLNL